MNENLTFADFPKLEDLIGDLEKNKALNVIKDEVKNNYRKFFVKEKNRDNYRVLYRYEIKYFISEIYYLLLDGKIEAFVEEYGEVCENTKKFFEYIKDLGKKIYIESDSSYYDDIDKYLQQDGTDDDRSKLAEEKEIIDNTKSEDVGSEEIKQFNSKILREDKPVFDSVENEFSKEVVFYVIDKIKDMKKEGNKIYDIFLIYYYAYRDKILTNSLKSPGDMDKDIQLLNLFEEIHTYKKDEKEIIISRYLDICDFWGNFKDNFNDDISKNEYWTLYNKFIDRTKSYRTQLRKRDELAGEISNFLNNLNLKSFLQNSDIEKKLILYKTEKECSLEEKKEKIIKQIFKNIMVDLPQDNAIRNKDKKGKAMNKIEKDKKLPCNNKSISEDIVYNKTILILYAKKQFNDKVNKIIEEHLKTCSKCKDFVDNITTCLNYRQNRDLSLSYKLQSPYSNPQILTQEQYINQDINYFKKEFKENPCETNFYYLVSAYVKNGSKKHAQELLKEGFNLYKDNVFVQKTTVYLQEKD